METDNHQTKQALNKQANATTGAQNSGDGAANKNDANSNKGGFEDATTLSMIAHLLSFVEGGIIGPLVIYLWKKDDDSFIAFHSLQSFYFGMLFLVISLFTLGIGLILFFIPYFIFELIALVKANQGEWYQLPFVGKWAYKKHFPTE